jgi:hypothetical protein
MSITKIETKLFLTNFKSEDLRKKTILAVHATLLRNKEVPRTYIPNTIETKSFACNIVNDALLSDINHIVEDTNKLLATIDVSTKSITSLSSEDKNELLSILEDLLLNGWGSGSVHYEYLRIMPQGSCGLLNWLKKLKFEDDNCTVLKNILSKRLQDSLVLSAHVDTLFSPGQRRYHQSILMKSYNYLIEKQWKNNWSHQNNYLNDDFKKLSSLILIEDLIND